MYGRVNLRITGTFNVELRKNESIKEALARFLADDVYFEDMQVSVVEREFAIDCEECPNEDDR